ncbi:MAG TPA: hypothetical protein P5243_01105 [Bacteroidales bacterium]|jgi:hypothetical protein|nr:hypothetical protein [Bacteroidales bacterium]
MIKTNLHTITLTHINLDAEGIHILAPCTIKSQNNTEAYLIIDTGASKSVFDTTYLHNNDYVEIETESIESSHITDMISGTIIKIHSICIDNRDYFDFEALSMSLSHINSIYSQFVSKPVIGLIGGNFLQKYNAVISYSNMTLQLL